MSLTVFLFKGLGNTFGNALGNAAIAGIEQENAISEQAQQTPPTSSLLTADNPNSQVSPVAAFLSGPYADTGNDAEALANYDPLNGPLLASSDRASMLAGVYGPAGYSSLSAAQTADVRSLQGEAPWLDSGEWSSNVFQSYIDANGDVNVIGNPVYDASGMPVMENGQQVVEVPASVSVTPTAAELAEARSSSGLAYVDSQISGFNNIVGDSLVDQGTYDLQHGDRVGFYLNGIQYAFYSAFMPNSVEGGVIGIAGGTVIGKGLGLLAKGATAAFPLLGRDLGDLAGDSVSSVKNWWAGDANNEVLVNGEGAYGDLVGTLDDGFQAHHLNQNAAFGSVIPKDQGFSIGIRGNAFTEFGTPHYEFHSSLEAFWDQYRPGGDFFGVRPSSAQYGGAVTQALEDAGLPPSEAQRLSDLAAQNRSAYGLSPNDPAPRIPRKIYQSGGN